MLNITLFFVTLTSLLVAIKVYGHYTKQINVLEKRISDLENSRDQLGQKTITPTGSTTFNQGGDYLGTGNGY